MPLSTTGHAAACSYPIGSGLSGFGTYHCDSGGIVPANPEAILFALGIPRYLVPNPKTTFDRYDPGEMVASHHFPAV
jgi:hypothetical protein